MLGVGNLICYVAMVILRIPLRYPVIKTLFAAAAPIWREVGGIHLMEFFGVGAFSRKLDHN